MKTSELVDMGYANGVYKLQKKLQENAERKQWQQAKSWTMLGATVNESFFDVTKQASFSQKDIEQALWDLDCGIRTVEGKRWYQIFKTDFDVRFMNCIKKLNSQKD